MNYIIGINFESEEARGPNQWTEIDNKKNLLLNEWAS
jgi:hypothetical protein